MNGNIMVYILKMLSNGIYNTYLLDCNPETTHQFHRVIISSSRSAEPWHCHAHNSLTASLQLIKSFHAHQQRQRGIQSTADTYHRRFGMGMHQSFHQTHHLDVEDLFTRDLHVLHSRNERMRRDRAFQFKLPLHLLGESVNNSYAKLLVEQREFHVSLRIDISGIPPTFRAELLHVNLRHHYLRLKTETSRLNQQLAILVYHGVSTINHVLGALPKSTTAIHVTCHRTGTLLAQQTFQVVMLTYQLIAGRQIENNVRARQRQLVTRRSGSPYILAYLNAKEHTVSSAEQLDVSGHVHDIPRIPQFHVTQILGGGEPSLLIKLTIIGQVELGHHAQYVPFLDNNSAIEQQVAHGNGSTNDGDDIQLASKIHQTHNALLHPVKQQLLAE